MKDLTWAGPIAGAMAAVGQATVQWRQLAEQMEQQRNEAFQRAELTEQERDIALARVRALETAGYTLVPMSDGSTIRICRVCENGTRGNGLHSKDCWFGAALLAAAAQEAAGEGEAAQDDER